jgi:Spy/CpxP family protein refolding chaperone
MAQITKDWFVFQILDEIQAQYWELVKLVLNTESMDNNEKQYWFDILPSMTDEQVDRLFDILETERRKLEDLEVKYQEEIKTLNEKHLIEWQEFQTKESREKIKKAEASDKDWSSSADDVLKMLDDF